MVFVKAQRRKTVAWQIASWEEPFETFEGVGPVHKATCGFLQEGGVR